MAPWCSGYDYCITSFNLSSVNHTTKTIHHHHNKLNRYFLGVKNGKHSDKLSLEKL